MHYMPSIIAIAIHVREGHWNHCTPGTGCEATKAVENCLTFLVCLPWSVHVHGEGRVYICSLVFAHKPRTPAHDSLPASKVSH